MFHYCCLHLFCVFLLIFSLLCIFICPNFGAHILGGILLCIVALLTFHTCHGLCDEAFAKLNETDTNETSSSSEAMRSHFESYLEWSRNQGMLPHWSSSGRSEAEAGRLRAMRENNPYLFQSNETLRLSYETLQSQSSLDFSVDESSFTESEYDCNVEYYFLRRATHRRLYPSTEEQSFAESSSIENEEENNLLPQVTHRDHHASTEEQSIAGCSSAENEQDSNAESNLVSEVTHRSQHPSTSAEARPITSSQFVTVAEVY